ncbi:hypothetical protein B0T25DRAFT_518717 [Lasiosphaeria hispida]|uniref:Uncharacterized protein n=1 Tax=Lasiosphaeria hispida TaxID=260671 RepID=A0AAJ0MEP7_9PEZI|nr:hypothetical protein B0T25DRAFT_518717 [Lasiosphaeria hispida]
MARRSVVLLVLFLSPIFTISTLAHPQAFPTMSLAMTITNATEASGTGTAAATATATTTSEFVYNTTLCDAKPDKDIAGLGVRVGVWLQCAALLLTIAGGSSRVTSALPAALMTILVYNIALSMKLSIYIFDKYPVVQDLWVAHGQLWLLTTIIPFAMLFGKWSVRTVGLNRNVLFLFLWIYTYGQAIWIWGFGWQRFDEVVCRQDIEESEVLHGTFKMFTQNGRVAMIVIYGLGIAIFALALPTYLTGRPGILSSFLRRLKTRRWCVRALVLATYCIPLYFLALWLVESTVRRGKEDEWLGDTGQWLALGVGVGTFLESSWYLSKAVYREMADGKAYCDDLRFLGGEVAYDDGDASDGVQLMPQPKAAYLPRVYQRQPY